MLKRMYYLLTRGTDVFVTQGLNLKFFVSKGTNFDILWSFYRWRFIFINLCI